MLRLVAGRIQAVSEVAAPGGTNVAVCYTMYVRDNRIEMSGNND